MMNDCFEFCSRVFKEKTILNFLPGGLSVSLCHVKVLSYGVFVPCLSKTIGIGCQAMFEKL